MKTVLERLKANGGSYNLWFWQVVGLAIVYHLAARVGLSMAYLQSNTSPVWPPTGIAIAALMLLGCSRWPGVALGVLLEALHQAREIRRTSGGDISIVASVCGTKEDPQDLEMQVRMLKESGAIVFHSSARAVRFCQQLLNL